MGTVCLLQQHAPPASAARWQGAKTSFARRILVFASPRFPLVLYEGSWVSRQQLSREHYRERWES